MAHPLAVPLRDPPSACSIALTARSFGSSCLDATGEGARTPATSAPAAARGTTAGGEVTGTTAAAAVAVVVAMIGAEMAAVAAMTGVGGTASVMEAAAVVVVVGSGSPLRSAAPRLRRGTRRGRPLRQGEAGAGMRACTERRRGEGTSRVYQQTSRKFNNTFCYSPIKLTFKIGRLLVS